MILHLRLLLLVLLATLIGCDPQQDRYRKAMHRLLNNDSETAVLLLTGLAENGYAPAQFRLGLLYRMGLGVAHNPSQAVYWFGQAARQGDVGAQYQLADAYRRGDGIPETPELAFQGFHRLAEQHYAPAQYQVALAYEQGYGVASNVSDAATWFQRAAIGGQTDAAQRLARACRRGELGLPQDEQQAQYWEQIQRPARF